MTKTEIALQLRSMLKAVLFGDELWPIANPEKVRDQLISWGLIEIDATNTIHTTALGLDLDLPMWSAFTGWHEPAEVPDMLAQMELISETDADRLLERWEHEDERMEVMLPPILARLYRRHFNQ
jgi:hypothetical protein